MVEKRADGDFPMDFPTGYRGDNLGLIQNITNLYRGATYMVSVKVMADNAHLSDPVTHVVGMYPRDSFLMLQEKFNVF